LPLSSQKLVRQLMQDVDCWYIPNNEKSHFYPHFEYFSGQPSCDYNTHHIHVTVINSGHATLLSTAHTVGLHCADCGYNPA